MRAHEGVSSLVALEKTADGSSGARNNFTSERTGVVDLRRFVTAGKRPRSAIMRNVSDDIKSIMRFV